MKTKEYQWDYSVLKPNMDYEMYLKAIKNKSERKKERKRKKHKRFIQRHPERKTLAELAAEAPKKPYIKFLKSEYWKRIRKIVLKRDNYSCQLCKTKTNLQIHHSTYRYKGMEYKHMDCLHTLCEVCHYEVQCNQ